MLNTIIHGDCLHVMKGIPDKSVDLVLTDPPYGLGMDGQKKSISKNPKHNRKEHHFKGWDNTIPNQVVFEEILRVSKNQIIWGANYFNQYLPQGYKGWLIWDKGQHGLTMSDCEIAFSSYQKPTRVKVINRAKLLRDISIHPTQKPVQLFQWCLENYSKEGETVFDPFSGSGTTAIACHNLNRNFICVEKDADYHAASVRRLEEHQRQYKLM